MLKQDVGLLSLVDCAVTARSWISLRYQGLRYRKLSNSLHSLKQQVMGDATRVRQVVLNLLSNATKFTHHGSILIKSRAEVTEEKKRSQPLTILKSDWKELSSQSKILESESPRRR